MKIPLWCLLLLLACLFTPGRGDCQGQCAACSLLLQQQQELQQAFNTMVCLLECEGHVSATLTWEECKRAIRVSHHPAFPEGGALLKRMGGGLESTSFDPSPRPGQMLRSAAARRFREGEDEDRLPLEQRSLHYDSSPPDSSVEGEDPGLLDEEGVKPRVEGRKAEGGEEEEEEEEEVEDSAEAALPLSKRFGGFQRGRHGYRKLVGSPARPLQKRYGGFIGVRKSARKWNSQKRVNQLLRQYLGLRSSRSGRFNNVPVTRVWRQNKL